MRKSLTKNQILKKKTEIDRIFKQGDIVSCRGMRLVTIGNNLFSDRFIIIPAKKFGNSIQRNKIRRQMKELFRLYSNRVQNSEFATCKDIALVIYPGKVLDYTQLKSNFYNLLDQVYLK